MLIIIAIIILVFMRKKKLHISMEPEQISHSNPYYTSHKKTEEHNIDVLNNSGFGDTKQEEIYEPLGEEPVHYDVPRKSTEKPELPKREIRTSSFAVVEHENMSSNALQCPSQYENVADSSSSPHTSLSQYKNVSDLASVPDSSKNETDSSAPVDLINNGSPYAETGDDDYVSMKSLNHEPDGAYSQVTDD